MGQRICIYEKCGRIGKRKGGVCSSHYTRLNRYGAVEECLVEGCSLPRSYRRYCGDHRHLVGALCSIEGCNQGVYGRGWCQRHWKRWRAHGNPVAGRIITKRRITTEGYVEIWMPDRESSRKPRIMEHRYVMEIHLGRRLQRHETVHHIDGNKQNNDIANLELWASSHPRGQRVADLVDWAERILHDYGPYVESLDRGDRNESALLHQAER